MESNEPRARHSAAAQVRFWLIAALGVAIDLTSKHIAFRELRQHGSMPLIDGVLEFQTTMNTGALFGFGQGMTPLFLAASVVALVLVVWMFMQSGARRWSLHVALAGIMAGALGNFYDRVTVRLTQYAFETPAGRVALWCEMTHSADGQRVALREYPPDAHSLVAEIPASAAEGLPPPVGCVRDFIKISKKWLGGRDVWPWIFNVADMLLVGGVGLLMLHILLERPRAPAAAASVAAGSAASVTAQAGAAPAASGSTDPTADPHASA